MKACLSEGYWPTKLRSGSVGPSNIALSPATVKSTAKASQRMFSPVNNLWYSEALHVEGTLMGLVECSSSFPDMEINSECPNPFDTMSRSIDSRQGVVKGAGCTNVREEAAGVE